MKAITLSLALAAVAAPAHQRIAVNVGGRVTADMRFGWPGVYFEGRFRGTSVTVKVDNASDFLRISVDGKARATLTRPGPSETTVDGLPPGIHVVRLDKLTESQTGSARFLGLFVNSGTSLPAAPRTRQIEFIGDSFTVGYGNTSPVGKCDSQAVHDTTDTSRAFGPILARRLNADYRIIAYSGFGVVRNYAGSKSGLSLPVIYGRTIPGEVAPATPDRSWRPQVIVINLGTNDFSTPLHSGEKWSSDDALRADYRQSYVDFVRRLRGMHPRSRIILMGGDTFYNDVKAVASATSTVAVRFGPLELTACNGHPSLKDDRQLAALLASEIE